MAQTMSMPPKGFSKKPDRPGRYPRPLSLQTLAAKLGPQRLYTRSRGDAAATTVLIAPAGAGESHTMAGFARPWTAFTGRRVIGLTTSTNAARVLAHEGLAESYNIAQFLGKDRRLRRASPCTGTMCWSWTRPASSARLIWSCSARLPGRPGPGSSPPATPRSSGPSKPVACSGCWPRKSRHPAA